MNARLFQPRDGLEPVSDHIRRSVGLALTYWPNAGGDETAREYLRRAFRMIRGTTKLGQDLWCGLADLELDAYRHEDM